jgi:hypothetical protein
MDPAGCYDTALGARATGYKPVNPDKVDGVIGNHDRSRDNDL